MKGKHLLPICMILFIVAGMTAAAELFDNKEIIFPEIAAIAVGGLAAPKFMWNTDKARLFFCIVLCAVLGVGTVLFVPLPVWAQMTVAFAAAQMIFIHSRTTFAPMISAIVLPVMLQTDTVVYIISAVVFTLLILVCRCILEKTGLAGTVPYKKTELPGAADYKDAFVRILIAAALIFAALTLDVRFMVAPPLLVAFTEFSKPTAAARKKPVKAVALIGACAFLGAASRYVFCIRYAALPLYPAAALAMLAVILLMGRVNMFIPPAGAVAILAMLIPEAAVLRFPLEITAGAAAAMGAALLAFRDKSEKA